MFCINRKCGVGFKTNLKSRATQPDVKPNGERLRNVEFLDEERGQYGRRMILKPQMFHKPVGQGFLEIFLREKVF